MQIDVNDYANDAGRDEQGAAHLSAVDSLEWNKDLGRSFPSKTHFGVEMRPFLAT